MARVGLCQSWITGLAGLTLVEMKHSEIVLMVHLHCTVLSVFRRLFGRPHRSSCQVKVKVVRGASKLCEFLQKGGQTPVYCEDIAAWSILLETCATPIVLLIRNPLIVIVVVETTQPSTTCHLLFVALSTVLTRQILSCASFTGLSAKRKSRNLSDIDSD